MILPFDVIILIISYLKPVMIYNKRSLSKEYYKYIVNCKYDFSSYSRYDLIYSVKRNKIKLIEWLLKNKMYHPKLLTYSIIYSNKKTIIYIMKQNRKYKRRYVDLLLAKDRNDSDIYHLVNKYFILITTLNRNRIR